MTKIELQQHNARLAAENSVLRARVSELEVQVVAITSVASAVNAGQRGERTAYVMPQWQKDRAAAMAAAKEHALRTGTSVKVSSFL